MTRSFAVIGVPSSAGAHHAGQDLAPTALRSAGLITKLRAAGIDITDLGDVVGERFVPDRFDATHRNIDAVVRVATRVAEAVEDATRSGQLPIVLGGDCTITIGVVAGLQRAHADVRLAYLDGDADLNAPEHSRSGVLDASGIAHLLGIADDELARLGTTTPMLRENQLALLGYDPDDPDSFDAEAIATRPGLLHVSYPELREDPAAAAHRAVDALDHPGGSLVVHFDVDSVDGRDLPLANFPHYGTGIRLADAERVLSVLIAAPSVAALVMTEVNPTHDPDGSLIERYVDTVVRAVDAALRTSGGRSYLSF